MIVNNLKMHINAGDEVVVSKEFFKDKSLPIEKRIFICDGNGFGTESFTHGSAIFGKWKDGSGDDRIEGDMIDVEETKQFCPETRKRMIVEKV